MDNYELAVEELQDAKTPIEKSMILQKYGLIEPKLTEWERALIKYEETGVLDFKALGWRKANIS